MVRLLIANKADVSVTDQDGATAIQLANEETMLAFMEAVLDVQQLVSRPAGAEEVTIILSLSVLVVTILVLYMAGGQFPCQRTQSSVCGEFTWKITRQVTTSL